MKKMIFMALMLCLISINGFAQNNHLVYGCRNIISYVDGRGYYIFSTPIHGENNVVSIFLGASKESAGDNLHRLMALKNREVAIVNGLNNTYTEVYKEGGRIKAETIGVKGFVYPFKGINKHKAVQYIKKFNL